MNAPFRGNKASAGGGGSGDSAPDTLFSDDVVELVLGLSEGPIKGLVNGARSFLVADTPLVDTDGKPNLGKFDLRIHKGITPADKIVAKLGGTGASTSVGVQLETNVPVVRSGSHTQLNFIEVRILVQRLLSVGDKGEGPHSVSFKVELKPSTTGVWGNAYPSVPPNVVETLGSGATRYTNGGAGVGTTVNPAYRKTYIQSSPPTGTIDANAIWFDLDDPTPYKPYLRVANAWAAIAGATRTVVAAPGYSYWQWTEGTVTRRAYYGANLAAPGALNTYDFWIAPSGTPTADGPTTSTVSFVWNGSAWVNEMDWADPPISGGGTITLNGKTTSTYVKELRIPVAPIAGTYDVRVTKITAPNTQKLFADIQFESFQEITTTPLQFDGLACAHMTIKSSDQFSSVPEFTGIYDGREIRIPTNYDPETRVYSGIWDGTFKIAYSNNLAWIVYDLVTHDRYGMAAYYDVVLDKYATYAFGQHCDAHKFTYNEWITEPRNLTEAIDYICGIAGGRFVDPGDGFATILFDADDQPAVHLFTPENVIDGVFSYAFTDITSRKNDFTVSYVNENYNWVEDRRRLFDSAHVAQHGRNPEEFVAVGCINEEEAVRRARLRLAVSLGEKAVCSWKTNRQGLYIAPYSIVLIGDPDSGFGITGRIKGVTEGAASDTSILDENSIAISDETEQNILDETTPAVITASQVEIRDPIYFEAGIDYKIHFSHVGADGLQILTYDLVTTAGSTTTLTLATPLTETLIDQTNFSISAEGETGAPKAWRITNIEEVDGEPDQVSLTAIEVNRLKWAFVDGVYTPPDVIQTGQVTNNTFPVSNIRVEGQTSADGIHSIVMAWDASPSPLTRFNRIYYQVNGGQFQVLTETRDSRYTLVGAQPADYTFSIVAVNMNGQESPPVIFTHKVLGAVRAVTPPVNLKLLDGVDPNTFRGRNPAFSWEASIDPFFYTYRVRIFNNSSGAVVRAVDTALTTFLYDYTSNKADFGGTASRTFRIEVRAVDAAGSESQALVLLVNNPQVLPPSVVGLTTQFFALHIDCVKPADLDYQGMVVYASTTAGFTPGSGNLIYDGPDCSFRTTIAEGQIKYVRVGFYDDFDKVLNLSTQFSSTGQGLLPNTVSYEKLTTELKAIIDNAGGQGELATTVEQHTSQINGLVDQTYGSWMVKIQTQQVTGGGTRYVTSGFGLAQAGGGGAVTSDFVIAADRFLVTPPYDSNNPIPVKPVFAIGTRNGVAEVGIHGNMVLDGSITAQSLSVTTISAIASNIGTMTAGILKSADSKFVIDLTAGSLTVLE